MSLHHARCQCVSNLCPRPPGTSLTWQRGRGAKETRVHRNACKYWSRPAAVCQSASPHNKQVKVCWAHAQVCEQSPVSVAGLCRGGLGPGHPEPGASVECNQSVRGCQSSIITAGRATALSPQCPELWREETNRTQPGGVIRNVVTALGSHPSPQLSPVPALWLPN